MTDAGLTRAGASAEATTDRARDAAPVPVLIGGVSELFQSDLDLGRLVVEQLQDEGLGGGAFAEELHYGAVAVAQRLEVLRPARLILVSAVARGRPPGTVVRSLLVPPVLDAATVQAAVGDAVTGYVHPDLVIEIACAFGVLPPRTVLIEAEPAVVGPGEGLSPQGQLALEQALRLVRLELGRAPLLALALELKPLVDGDRLEDSVSLLALRDLLVELGRLDAVGHWGRTFALRDRFRLGIAHSVSSETMDHRDWALWWALVEELDRVEAAEAAAHD